MIGGTYLGRAALGQQPLGAVSHAEVSAGTVVLSGVLSQEAWNLFTTYTDTAAGAVVLSGLWLEIFGEPEPPEPLGWLEADSSVTGIEIYAEVP